MPTHATPTPDRAAAADDQSRAWVLSQSALWLAAMAAIAAVGAHYPAATLQLTAAGLLLSYGALVWIVRGGRTAADWVTLARFAALLAVLLWTAEAGTVSKAACVLLALSLAADLLDGWVARRRGGSPAGALLDMEADQAAMLAMAAMATVFARTPAWVLLLAAVKCLFTLLMTARGRFAYDPKPIDGDNTRAKRICAAVVVLQLVTLWPPLPVAWATAAAALAVALLALSYGLDLRHLWARPQQAPR